MNKIKKLLSLSTCISLLLPILIFKFPNSNLSISLGIINFGIKYLLISFFIMFISLNIFYLNENIRKKFSIIFSFSNLVITITVFLMIYFNIKNIINLYAPISKILNIQLKFHFGIILIFINVILTLLIDIYEFFKKVKINEEENN